MQVSSMFGDHAHWTRHPRGGCGMCIIASVGTFLTIKDYLLLPEVRPIPISLRIDHNGGNQCQLAPAEAEPKLFCLEVH